MMDREAVTEYLFSKTHEPFKWGVNDCILFQSGAILAGAGHDPADFIRGTYDSKIGAYKHLSKIGCKMFSEAVVQVFSSTDLRLTTRNEIPEYGDPALAFIENMDKDILGATAGIMITKNIIAIPGKKGLEIVPIKELTHVWKM